MDIRNQSNPIPGTICYSLSHLRVFGSNAWVHNHKRCKGQPKALKLTFLGYEPGSKAYWFSDGSKRIIISRSANFNEQAGGKRVEDFQILLPVSENSSLDGQEQLSIQPDKAGSPRQLQGDEEELLTPQSPKLEEETQEIQEPALRRSPRANKGVPPQRFTVGEASSCNEGVNVYQPQIYQEVLKLPKTEKENRLRAMQNEMAAMQELQGFTECNLPEGHKALGSKWIFKKKVSADGQTQYKAR